MQNYANIHINKIGVLPKIQILQKNDPVVYFRGYFIILPPD